MSDLAKMTNEELIGEHADADFQVNMFDEPGEGYRGCRERRDRAHAELLRRLTPAVPPPAEQGDEHECRCGRDECDKWILLRDAILSTRTPQPSVISHNDRQDGTGGKPSTDVQMGQGDDTPPTDAEAHGLLDTVIDSPPATECVLHDTKYADGCDTCDEERATAGPVNALYAAIAAARKEGK